MWVSTFREQGGKRLTLGHKRGLFALRPYSKQTFKMEKTEPPSKDHCLSSYMMDINA